MAGLRHSISFTARYLSFFFLFFFFLLSGWANGSCKRLQTVAKFQQILNHVCEGRYKCIFPRSNLLPFPRFPGWMENTYGQLSRNLFNQFENYLRITIQKLEFYKHLWHEWWLPHNLVAIIQMENVSPGRTEKRWIAQTQFNRFYAKFSPKWSHGI